MHWTNRCEQAYHCCRCSRRPYLAVPEQNIQTHSVRAKQRKLSSSHTPTEDEFDEAMKWYMKASKAPRQRNGEVQKGASESMRQIGHMMLNGQGFTKAWLHVGVRVESMRQDSIGDTRASNRCLLDVGDGLTP